MCSVCSAQTTESIPATDDHTYGSAAYIDESVHQLVCSVCQKQETFAHTPVDTWNNDTLYHWTSCEDCDGRLLHTEHTFSEGCLLPCDTCGYLQQTGHKLTGTYEYDTENHWQVCAKCSLQVDPVPHTYSSDCDEICNDCSFIRTATAEHSDEFCADESGHHRVCTACQRTTPHIQHTADRNSEEWQDLVCIQCAYVLRSSDRHTHELSNIQYDNHSHWGSCVCGEMIEAEVHTWDVSTGVCSVCNASYSADDLHQNFFTKLLNTLFKK